MNPYERKKTQPRRPPTTAQIVNIHASGSDAKHIRLGQKKITFDMIDTSTCPVEIQAEKTIYPPRRPEAKEETDHNYLALMDIIEEEITRNGTREEEGKKKRKRTKPRRSRRGEKINKKNQGKPTEEPEKTDKLPRK